MIVKCQISTGTTEEVRQVLIYNKERDVMVKFPTNPEWDKWFGDELKIYAYATFLRRGIVGEYIGPCELVILDKVSPRNW